MTHRGIVTACNYERSLIKHTPPTNTCFVCVGCSGCVIGVCVFGFLGGGGGGGEIWRNGLGVPLGSFSRLSSLGVLPIFYP